MSFLKGAAHLLLIWFAIVAVLAGTAVLTVAYDVLGNVVRDIQPAHYTKGSV